MLSGAVNIFISEEVFFICLASKTIGFSPIRTASRKIHVLVMDSGEKFAITFNESYRLKGPLDINVIMLIVCYNKI